MSTLDEITKEKQRVSEALARVDAQREKLSSQLGELEATARVLARYGKGTQAKATASARTPTATTNAAAPERGRRRPRTAPARATGGKSSALNLNDQVLALATGKTQQEITAACKGARPLRMGRERSNAPPSDQRKGVGRPRKGADRQARLLSGAATAARI